MDFSISRVGFDDKIPNFFSFFFMWKIDILFKLLKILY